MRASVSIDIGAAMDRQRVLERDRSDIHYGQHARYSRGASNHADAFLGRSGLSKSRCCVSFFSGLISPMSSRNAKTSIT